MNALNYDAGVIGNHEFNYGLSYLNRAIAQARFPFLAANAYAPDDSHAYAQATTLTRSGVRVAVIGATTPGSMIWDRDKLRGRIEIRDIVPSVRAAVGDVRAHGAQVVIVVLHSGARYVGFGWMGGGLLLYVAYRTTQGKSLTKRA